MRVVGTSRFECLGLGTRLSLAHVSDRDSMLGNVFCFLSGLLGFEEELQHPCLTA